MIVTDNGPSDPTALAEFEAKLGGLPADYREFIAAHNGAGLCGTSILQGAEKRSVGYINGIQDPEFWHEDYPPNSMPVGDDGSGNTYLMLIQGEARGQIYFLDHEISSDARKGIEQLPLVADSFAEFLDFIQDFDPEDPASKELFNQAIKKNNLLELERQAILQPKKSWWK